MLTLSHKNTHPLTMLMWPHLEVSVPHAIGQGGPSPVEQEEVVEESRARSNVQVTRSGLDTQLGKGTDSWELKEMGQNSAGTQTHVCFAELQSYNRHFNKTYGAWIDICPWETSRKEGMAVTGKDPASLQDQMNKTESSCKGEEESMVRRKGTLMPVRILTSYM